MATTAKYLGANLIKHLTGRVSTSTDRAALNMLQVATDGTQQATKFITTDTSTNQGVVKATAFHLGTSGSEDEVTATGAEMSQAFDLSVKAEVLSDATRTGLATDNGKIFFLIRSAGTAYTLPSLSLVTPGWRCRFIIKTATGSVANTITEYATDDTNTIVVNYIAEIEVTNAENAPQNTGCTTITLVHGTAIAGDWVEVTTDGVWWYAYGATKVRSGITLA